MNILRKIAVHIFLWTCVFNQARAATTAIDDTGHTIRLTRPAQRIVSLSAHATELVFAAGAGTRLVGVDESSNYPPAARALPRIGRFGSYDVERILSLHPDLVIGWASGTPPALLDKLATLGVPTFLSEPRELQDIASNLRRIGALTGTHVIADKGATAFRQRLAALTARYGERPRVSVFYQVWSQPLMTLGRTQIISHALRVCGGENIFATLAELAPVINREAVIAADPEVLLTSAKPGAVEPLAEWEAWPGMTAVKRGNLFDIDPDWLTRPTPRMLDGIEAVCKDLEVARGRR